MAKPTGRFSSRSPLPNYGNSCFLQYLPNYRDCEALWELVPDVSWAVAKASTQLEHLSTLFMVDASYFLDARKPSWTWPNSTAVILTLQLLTPDGTPTEIDNLLQAAAGAIPKMPVD
jgi:hypothetical protein